MGFVILNISHWLLRTPSPKPTNLEKNQKGEVIKTWLKYFKGEWKRRFLESLGPIFWRLPSILEKPDEHRFDATLIMDLFFNSVYEKGRGGNE